MENIKVPATVLLVGKRFTGRSYVLRWMLKELNDRFDYGYLISNCHYWGLELFPQASPSRTPG